MVCKRDTSLASRMFSRMKMASQIRPYTKLEQDLHKDIMKLITKKKYHKLNADSCLIIFHRVYTVFALEHLAHIGYIKVQKNEK